MVSDPRAACTDDQIYPCPTLTLGTACPTARQPPDLFSKFPHLHQVSIHDLERRNETQFETHGPEPLFDPLDGQWGSSPWVFPGAEPRTLSSLGKCTR